MVKVLALFGIAAVVTVAIIWKNEPMISPVPENQVLTYAIPSVPKPETLGVSTYSQSSITYKVYKDEKLGIRIKYPEDFSIKESAKGNLEITKDKLKIEYTSEKLSENDLINTAAEKFINDKMASLGDKYKLVETISPISIGSITAITFSLSEDSREISYYFIPRDFSYLMVKNSTDVSDQRLISISDDIIYSTELL